MRSEAITVKQYIKEPPDDHRDAIETVRQVILENLPGDYEEVMNWGMITYQVPLETYPDTYNEGIWLILRLISLDLNIKYSQHTKCKVKG